MHFTKPLFLSAFTAAAMTKQTSFAFAPIKTGVRTLVSSAPTLIPTASEDLIKITHNSNSQASSTTALSPAFETDPSASGLFVLLFPHILSRSTSKISSIRTCLFLSTKMMSSGDLLRSDGKSVTLL